MPRKLVSEIKPGEGERTMRNSWVRHSTWNMYLSRRFRWERSAESSSVVRERDARAVEMSVSGD
jgi:hypothetical protein